MTMLYSSLDLVIDAWQQVKAPVIIPLLRAAVAVGLTMLVMLVIDRMYMSIIIFVVKLFGRKPDKCYKWEPMAEEDIEIGSSEFLIVLIQIPMYNEKELSIGAACGLSWPSDKIIIQVLDDSTDPTIEERKALQCSPL
ncbi:putative glucomannan 4-beta-mannosyltransferase [Dioscorea sansibarensis]